MKIRSYLQLLGRRIDQIVLEHEEEPYKQDSMCFFFFFSGLIRLLSLWYTSLSIYVLGCHYSHSLVSIKCYFPLFFFF